ncbi:sensor histidine kinase [Actinomadura macrotermitis]|uniref:sensor histidine kinase n=1 Tax=Actinomadura macrotermitis TaxID=2585200 RepID=UPI0012967207|nr:HAMP domain-containing sensor histidine kinase [Actinomadura macrotermitis]
MANRLPRLPQRTVRFRLTLLYGALFLACGTGLLAITYALVSHATSGTYTYQDQNHAYSTTTGADKAGGEQPSRSSKVLDGEGLEQRTTVLTREQADAQSRLFRRQADRQRAEQLHQLLVQSGFALAIMTVISIVLGWVVAGRVLHRLRTITAAARGISAADLHERLALAGPDDELKELGDTFDRLLARLEASFQAQRRFIANASHELRTPLARQRTLAQVALADPGATVESLRAAHERVLAAGAQQERLIAALLVLARGQSGLGRREPFDLAGLAGEVLAARRAEAARLGLRVRASLAPADAAGDAHLAERLVVNLVDNALRHNAPDGHLEVATGTRDGRGFLTVANSGPPVPADDVDRLFEPFERLGADRTSGGGLGIGLSIVRAVADAHDADVTARPRPGGGLVINVTFPAPGVPDRDGRYDRLAPVAQ